MKLATPKPQKLVLFFVLLFSSLSYAQTGNSQIFVYYPGSPNPIVFGSTITVSSSEVEITIRNIPTNGNPSLTLNSDTWIQFSNANIGLKPGSINTNASLSQGSYNLKFNEYFKFTLQKLNNTCGTYSTKITITSNASNYTNGIFEFYIQFTNVPAISVLGGSPTQTIPNGQTMPISTNGTTFGTVDVGANSTRTHIITNTGTCPLTLNTITLHGYIPGTGSTGVASTEFSIVTSPANTINPGSVSYLVVQFSPTTPGTKYGIITITNSDPTKNPYTYVISGEGFNPTITGPGGLIAEFRLWLKSTRGIYKQNNSLVNKWWDLGSQGKDATANSGNEPTFLDNSTDNINFNPVVKFSNNGSTINQFMYNIENGFYTQEMFVVMLPDSNVDVSAAPGVYVFSGKDDLTPNGNTGIGFGDYTTRMTGERLWFNQWNSDGTNPKYAIGSTSTDFSNTKVGLINAFNTTTTPSDGMSIKYNAITVSDITPSDNSAFYNIGNLIDGKIYGMPYFIGKNNNATHGSFNGRVAEILTYAQNLAGWERNRVETYLAIKYGITLGVNGTSQNYVNSGGIIIWDVTANAGFNYNIAGIGRDVSSDLYQKQSKSVNSANEVTIGLGIIAATNSANPNEFNQDNDYLVWGSNNGTYTSDGTNTVTIKTGLTTTSTRINRKWKIIETGSDVATVIVSIPEAALTGTFSKLASEEYTLIIADDASFSDTSIIDVIPVKSDGNGNLTTWYDFDGTKYFTFGKAPKLSETQLVSIATGDYLVGEYALNLNSGSFTLACWIKNDGASATNRTIVGKGPDLIIRLNANHKVEALWDGVSRFTSNTSINDGKWHHITAVYTGGSAHLYIDGVLDKSVYSLPNPNPNFYRFSIGATYLSKSTIIDYFLGEIDELHIWDKRLTENQINYLMNQEIEKFTDNTVNGKILPQTLLKNEIKTIPWADLRAYYDFNSFYGSTVEGLTNDRNFLRIQYLSKDKTVVDTQTAPLPYETVADGAWSDSAIWKNGSVQRIPNDYSIVSGTPQLEVTGNIVKLNHNVTSNGNKTLLGLYVDGVNSTDYKTLSADNNSKVEVSHYLKLDGLIDLKGRSQLIQTENSELDATSKGFIKRDQQGTGNKFNYNYWSSPVGPVNSVTNNNNYTVAGVLKDGTTSTPRNITWISGYNGSLTSPISLARYWLWKFENGAQYVNWVSLGENGAVRPSQGFTLKAAGAVGSEQNYTFVGKPNNGTINSNSVLPNNLYLVGNPYPSAIDANQFILDNFETITGTLYFWEHSPTNATHNLGGYTGGYSTITLAGGTPPIAPSGIKGLGNSSKIPKQYIPVGQGFFVGGKAELSGAQPIVFKNSQREFVREDDTDELSVAISNTMMRNTSKSGRTTAVNRFEDNSNYPVYNDYYTKIRLGITTPNDFNRQLLIGFFPYEATESFDKGYDGIQIDTQPNDAYFILEEKALNILAAGAFKISNTYPLAFKTTVNGNVQIKIDAVEHLPANQRVFILDQETNHYYDITTEAATLTLTNGLHTDRFKLAFDDGTQRTLAVEEEALIPEFLLKVYLDGKNNKIHINKSNSIELKKVEFYNIIGQLLMSTTKFNNSESIITDIPKNLPTGVYLIKTHTNQGLHTKKVMK